jgi:putative N-acetyltransferase (TIGR04045 family)
MCWPERTCRRAAGEEEVALHHAIRHQVFVVEQGVFAGSDRDGHDADPETIKVLGWVAGVAAGAVRLYPLDGDGLWRGDRLAVLPAYRAYALGRPLVRFAVETAAKLGGREMVAHVQVANVRFFERLGWHRRGAPEVYVGLPHQLWAIPLAASPPRLGPQPQAPPERGAPAPRPAVLSEQAASGP